MDRWLRWVVYAYAGIILLALLFMYVGGDRWWPATIFLFAPRWLILLPMCFLFPLTLWRNRRQILLLILTFLVIVGPIMGYNISFGKPHPPSSRPLRVITCNLQNGEFDHAALDAFVENSHPDVVALQEFPPNQKIKALEGWNHIFEGDLHIFSRLPLTKGDFRKAFVPEHVWPRTCFLFGTLKSPVGDLTFATVHLPSPRYGLQYILDRTTLLSMKRKNLLIDETAYRNKMSKEVTEIVKSLPSPKIIVGDFNMPVQSSIYRQYWSTYQNAYSKLNSGYGWTERVTVKGIPVAVRIDHILVDKGVVPKICKTGPDVGSDHLPLIADIAL
jgi:endonuclease/exonuclease/phosphatase family metal-dependent hydrolase